MDAITDNEMGDVVDALTGEMPEARPEITDNADPFAGLVDSKGQSFDPSVHAVDAGGNPVMTNSGKLSRKRGRKPATDGRPVSSVKSGKPKLHPAEAAAVSTGTVAANMVFTLGRFVGGEEWAPVVDDNLGLDEHAQMEAAFIDYCREKGVTDLPPGAILAVALASYIAPRLTMPKTKTRMQRAKEWIAAKIAVGRVRGSGAKDNAKDSA